MRLYAVLPVRQDSYDDFVSCQLFPANKRYCHLGIQVHGCSLATVQKACRRRLFVTMKGAVNNGVMLGVGHLQGRIPPRCSGGRLALVSGQQWQDAAKRLGCWDEALSTCLMIPVELVPMLKEKFVVVAIQIASFNFHQKSKHFVGLLLAAVLCSFYGDHKLVSLNSARLYLCLD